MKRILFLLAIVASLVANSQTPTGDRVVARQSLFIRNRWIDSVLNEVGNASLQGKGRTILTANAINEVLGKYSQNEMDVWLIIGQSNARGRGEDSTQSPNPAPGTVYQYYGDSLRIMDNEIYDAFQSSAWPSFGITYNSLTKRKLCFVPTAVSGTPVLYQSFAPGDPLSYLNWGDSGVLYDSSINRLDSAIAKIKESGYNPVFKGILCIEGESDALAINAGYPVTGTMFKDSMLHMISKYRNHLGPDVPFYLYKIGSRSATSDVGFLAIRNATDQIAAADPLRNKIVFWGAYDFIARGMLRDAIHYNTAANNEMGRVSAENIVAYSGDSWQYRNDSVLYYLKGKVKIGYDGQIRNSARLQIDQPGNLAVDVNGFLGVIGNSHTKYPLSLNANLPGSMYVMHAGGNYGLIVGRSTADNGCGIITFYKSRGTDGDVKASVSVGDFIGRFTFQAVAADNNTVAIGAAIQVFADVVGSNYVDGRMIFNTFQSGSQWERLRLDKTGGVGVTTLSDNHSSAQFQVNAFGNRATLLTRHTTAQRDAISSPANGLETFNTDLQSKEVYTSEWQQMATISATKTGTATLSSGTITVNTTAIKSGSIVMVGHNTISGTQGILSVPISSYTVGTSFVINSSNAGDNSTVNWWIIN